MRKTSNSTVSPSGFSVFTLAIIALMYMFGFHNKRSEYRELLHKYETLEATCKTIKDPICNE